MLKNTTSNHISFLPTVVTALVVIPLKKSEDLSQQNIQARGKL